MALSIIPVIYVCFGQIPNYLLLNIELAARKNQVIVLGNLNAFEKHQNKSHVNVLFENLANFDKEAQDFASVYVHLASVLMMYTIYFVKWTI